MEEKDINVLGKNLLEMLRTESERARILTEKLEMEQALSSSLLQKQEDMSRLRRRATYQQSHLEELEDQTQQLEDSLDVQRKAVQAERDRRRSLEIEVAKLRDLLEEGPSSQDTCEEAYDAPTSTPFKCKAYISPESKKVFKQKILQPDAFLGLDEKENRLRYNQYPHVADIAATMAQKRNELLNIHQSSESKLSTRRDSIAASHSAIRKMYEEEKLQRERLQAEVAQLVFECERKRTMREEISVRKNRRATIGPCDFIKTRKSCLKEALSEKLVEIPKRQMTPRKKIAILSSKEPTDKFTTYLIQVGTPTSHRRMVSTRYSNFKRIYLWLMEHHESGFLEGEPLKYPPKGGSSNNPASVKLRRNWLLQTLLSVDHQQPDLVKLLLDYVGSLGS